MEPMVQIVVADHMPDEAQNATGKVKQRQIRLNHVICLHLLDKKREFKFFVKQQGHGIPADHSPSRLSGLLR